MPDILIVETSGEITPTSFKELSINDLYKKCGYRKQDDSFKEHIKWSIKYKRKTYSISVYGKAEGKAGKENKFEFPPPFDNILFYGKLAIVNLDKDTIGDISNELWNVIYEKMFGGFEDLDATQEEDENEPDELANMDKSMITETGYLKDGFVVDDDMNKIQDNSSDENENDVHIETSSDHDTESNSDDTEHDSDDDGSCSDEAELKEVEYIFSDDDDE